MSYEKAIDEVRRTMPFVIEIRDNPDRLIDLASGELNDDLSGWCANYLHGGWEWTAEKEAVSDGRYRLVFYFATLTDAIYFRLAHSHA